jgi:hypothetical protein
MNGLFNIQVAGPGAFAVAGVTFFISTSPFNVLGHALIGVTRLACRRFRRRSGD